MEMTAKELRIGNYLHDAKGKLAIVEGLSKDNIKAYSGMVTPLPLKPIPLTEEWLLDFGFKLDNNGHWRKNIVTHYLELIEMNKWFFPVFVELPELSNEQEQRVGLPRIGSVHELQNLFFALTGEELTKK